MCIHLALFSQSFSLNTYNELFNDLEFNMRRLTEVESSGEGIMTDKGIEIFNKKMAVSRGGIEIHYQNKPSYSESNAFVYLLLDSSGSMGDGQKLVQSKSGALKFAKEAISKGYRVGLIKFESCAIHLCDPQSDLSVLDSALANMNAGGSTEMTGAIRLATQKLLEKGPLRVICIVTDGFPDDPQTALDAARRAKENGIDIITVGTDNADKNFLEKLATRKELGIKVPRDQLEKTIVSTANMLPGK